MDHLVLRIISVSIMIAGLIMLVVSMFVHDNQALTIYGFAFVILGNLVNIYIEILNRKKKK